MDQVDATLLTMLQEDGGVSHAEMAAAVGLSTAGVHKRIRKLREQGYVERVAAQLDRGKLGLDLLAFVALSLERNDPESYRRISRELADVPSVLECYEVSGENDILLKVAVEDVASLRDFLHDLSGQLSSITRLETTIVLDELKRMRGFPVRSGEEEEPMHEGGSS